MKVDRSISSIEESVRLMLEGLDKRLTFDENMRAIELENVPTGAADVEFTVVHKLGKTPHRYLYNINKGGVLYDSRKDEWTTTLMYLKCTVSDALVNLTVF